MRKLFSYLCLLPMVAFAANGTLKGAGTESDPWRIEDYEDLKAVGSGTYPYSNHYVLTANIDASASNFTPIGAQKDAAEETAFTGSLNGRNHK